RGLEFGRPARRRPQGVRRPVVFRHPPGRVATVPQELGAGDEVLGRRHAWRRRGRRGDAGTSGVGAVITPAATRPAAVRAAVAGNRGAPDAVCWSPPFPSRRLAPSPRQAVPGPRRIRAADRGGAAAVRGPAAACPGHGSGTRHGGWAAGGEVHAAAGPGRGPAVADGPGRPGGRAGSRIARIADASGKPRRPWSGDHARGACRTRSVAVRRRGAGAGARRRAPAWAGPLAPAAGPSGPGAATAPAVPAARGPLLYDAEGRVLVPDGVVATTPVPGKGERALDPHNPVDYRGTRFEGDWISDG